MSAHKNGVLSQGLVLVFRAIDMGNILKDLFSVRSLAQALSGCAVYYGGVAFYHFESAGAYSKEPAILLTFLVPVAFAGLTVLWHMFDSNAQSLPPLWLKLSGAPIVLLPIYFSIASIAFPRSTETLTTVERLLGIVGGYLILPVLVVAIQQTPIGWALDLSFLSALLLCTLLKRTATRK